MRRDSHNMAGGAPVARALGQGEDWCLTEYICTAGPNDRPFEEHHEQVSIAAVIDGLFRYRADTGTAILHPGAFLLGNPDTSYECAHDPSTGDPSIPFHVSPQ